MKKPLGIIFDLGETVLEYQENNPEKATKKLLEISHNPNKVSVDTIQRFVKLLVSQTFSKRDSTELEINFQSFQRLLYETHKVSFEQDSDELEKIFIKNAYVSKPSNGIVDLFELLHSCDIKIGVLSNSSYAGSSLKYELDQHDLSRHLDFLISSTDYCLRKPNILLFNLAITKMDLNPEDIWFVGDTYEFDIKGASNAGLFPVWYNKKNKTANDEVKCLEIKDMNELIDIIKQLNEKSA